MCREYKKIVFSGSKYDTAGTFFKKIDFNSDVKDISGNNNKDKVSGNTLLTKNYICQDGNLENSTIFLVKDSFLTSDYRDFSLSFWIKTGTASNGLIISNKDWWNDSNIGWLIGVNKDYLVCNWKDESRSRLDIGAEQNIKIADNQWHHIAITQDRRGDAIFYLDGKEQKRISITGNGHTKTHLDFNIGANGLGKYSLENALLDRVQISNNIIPPQQVQQEYETYYQQLVPAFKTRHYSFDGSLNESTDKDYLVIAYGKEAYAASFAGSAFSFDDKTFIAVPNAELQNDLASNVCFYKDGVDTQRHGVTNGVAAEDYSPEHSAYASNELGLRSMFVSQERLSDASLGQVLFTLKTRRHSPLHGLQIKDAMLATRQGREILPKLTEQTLVQEDPSGITLNQERVTLEVGKVFTLVASIKAVNAETLNWENTDAEVAGLEVKETSCTVKALHPGRTTITVTSADGAYSAYCDVTVVAAFRLENQGFTDKSRWLIGAATPGSTLEVSTDSGVSLSGLVADDGRFKLELPPLLEHSQLYIQECYPHGIRGVKYQFEVRPSYNLLWDINAKASASSIWFKQPQYTADKSIDGDSQSRWASHNVPLPAWLTVDFGAEINFDLLQINEYKSRVSAFTLEVLQNGQWRPVYQGATIGPNAKLYFPRVKASQIRLNITAASDLPSIYELQIFDTEKPPVREIGDSALIELEARKSFDFFWEMANSDPVSPGYGLVSNSVQPRVCNVAQVGFALSAITIGIDNGWITREQGAARTLGTLNMLLNNAEQHKGFFYHFLDKLTAKRIWTSELSTIDSTLALNGVIVAGEYFGGEIKKMADQIYHKVEWPWFRDEKTNRFYMAWFPENGGGFHDSKWAGPVEQASMYVLAAGSPTHPVNGDMFYSIGRGKRSYRGSKPVFDTYFGSSFTNQFSNAWVDFRGKVDKVGDDWFNDAVLNSQISRQYSIDEQDSFKTFGPDSWGLSATKGPDGDYHGAYGAPPAIAASTDGTMALSGAVGAIVFTPKESLAAMQNYYRNHPYTWGKYGFNSSYNLDVTPYWYASSVNGLEKGISIVMLENYRTGIIWRLYMNNEAIKRGIAAIGLMEKE